MERATNLSTKDTDIQAYRYFLVDLDPDRPTKTASSDDELLEAFEVARRLVEELTAEEWPAPVAWGSSGNGVHLYFPMPLPVEEKRLVNLGLKALSNRFSTERIKIDTTVSNPSRIFRVPGTTNRKGESNEDRPHRQACLLPLNWLQVNDRASATLTKQMLEAFVEAHGDKPKTKRDTARQAVPEGNREADVWAKLITSEVVSCRGPESWEGGRRWIFTGCPFNKSHEQDAGTYLLEHADGNCSFGCHHDRCQGKDLGDLRRVLIAQYKVRGQEIPELLADDQDEWEAPVPLDDEEEYPDFPPGLLPRGLEELTNAIAAHNQTPPSQVKSISAAYLATATHGQYEIEIDGRIESLALYVCVAAGSGDRKSSDMKILHRPIDKYKQKSIEVTKAKLVEVQGDKEILQMKADKLRKRASKGADDELQAYKDACAQLEALVEPVPRDPVADDVTPEGLAYLMHQQGGSVALLSGEGGPFEGARSKYQKDSGISDFYLKFYSRESVTIKRRGTAGIYVPRPSLVIGVMVQEEHLRGLLADKEFNIRGYLARYSWSAARSRMGYRTKGARFPTEAARRWEEAMGRMLPKPGCCVPGEFPERNRLHVIGPALAAWEYFTYEDIEPRLAPDGDLYEVRVTAARVPTLVLKMAALWQLCDSAYREQPAPQVIQTEWILRAIAWAKLFAIPMAQKVLGMIGAVPGLSMASRILSAIKTDERREWTWSDFKRKHFNSVPVDQVRQGIEVLMERGYLRAKKKQTGGRPAERYEVNPKTFELDDLGRAKSLVKECKSVQKSPENLQIRDWRDLLHHHNLLAYKAFLHSSSSSFNSHNIAPESFPEPLSREKVQKVQKPSEGSAERAVEDEEGVHLSELLDGVI
jgi:hypothetical protein